jgi:hypothetical protein
MRRMIRRAGRLLLFVVLVLAVTGMWSCLWLPPHWVWPGGGGW